MRDHFQLNNFQYTILLTICIRKYIPLPLLYSYRVVRWRTSTCLLTASSLGRLIHYSQRREIVPLRGSQEALPPGFAAWVVSFPACISVWGAYSRGVVTHRVRFLRGFVSFLRATGHPFRRATSDTQALAAIVTASAGSLSIFVRKTGENIL